MVPVHHLETRRGTAAVMFEWDGRNLKRTRQQNLEEVSGEERWYKVSLNLKDGMMVGKVCIQS